MRTKPDGSFRSATEYPIDPYVGHRGAFSLAHWRVLDPQAAEQFAQHYPAEEIERRQLDFIAASGLSLRDTLKASMIDARTRYGGPHVATTHSSRTR